MTFSQFLSVLRARKWIALLVLVLTVGTTLAVSLILPKQYLATASVVIDAKPDPIAAMMYPGLASPAFMATQVDVIQSDRVAQRVVRMLKLTDNPAVREQWIEATGGRGSIEVWLAESLQKSLDVKPSKESNVINISYKSPDPNFAAVLANTFIQSFLETTVELKVDPARQYSTFFVTRSKEARDTLEKAQTRLSEYQKDKGIIASDERLDVENSRLNELSTQLVMMQALLAESGSRQVAARGASADRIQEVLNNPLLAGLKGELARSEARLQELNARLGVNHPQVVEAKANIAEMHSKIEAETRRVTGGVGVANTITRQREAELRASLENQRNKVLRMKAVRDEGAVLVRDVENAQRAYDAVQARLNQTTLESQTTQSNAFVLTQASAPVDPSSPKILLNTALSLFVGTLLALGTAFAMEFIDRRLRNVDDVSELLGLPVLGIMPKPTARRLLGGRPASLMQQRVLGRLPAANKGA